MILLQNYYCGFGNSKMNEVNDNEFVKKIKRKQLCIIIKKTSKFTEKMY